MIGYNYGKIGRNSKCPCGSGKKYKKCHGDSVYTLANGYIKKTPRSEFEPKMKALQEQLKQQQGFGRPIISARSKDSRFVAVGSDLHTSKKWETFHDFLLDYIKVIFGFEWGNAELKKNYDDRHTILQWYETLCKHQKKYASETTLVHSAPMIGAASAYLRLAYNLYILAHNAKIQGELIDRLKKIDQFPGAYYETFVAAAFIKAGFELEFEDESDSTQKHCEFTATHQETGAKFSVEAKARKVGKVNAKIGNQLYKALSKKANHTRVIFIDVNMPDDLHHPALVPCLEESIADLRSRELSLTIDGFPAPKAYVFVTNDPYQYNLQTADFRFSVIGEGFKIPDFKIGAVFPSIRTAVLAQEKHCEMNKLLNSLKDHYRIPSTFDGEIPEFAFGNIKTRLQIGQRYLIPNRGRQVVGKLVDATVVDKEKLVYGIYHLEGGGSIVASCPISDEELVAYHQYPDTFFGVYRKITKKTEDALELFNFFYDSYSNTPKSMLLGFMKDRSDYETIKEQTQAELALIYCEGLVSSLVNGKYIE